MGFETVTWKDNHVVLLDQTRLPHEEIYHEYNDPQDVALAITKMIVRGAPAIGVTAALGLALVAKGLESFNLEEARQIFQKWTLTFAATRPTAVNLFWAIERMKNCSEKAAQNTRQWTQRLLEEALLIRKEDIHACKQIGDIGQDLIQDGFKILTHCNAGALATAGWGTALGVVRSAIKKGKNISVLVDETRPFLQGARLTAWELMEDQIPATLITDNMAGHMMSKGEVDAVIVGADRIAANGDVANKIGTYSIAVLAKENGIPFYVAAPLSTIDLGCPSGKNIPIEERDPKEVLELSGHKIAPTGVQARHPAFDVTPAKYVSAIVTEVGIARAPYYESLTMFKAR